MSNSELRDKIISEIPQFSSLILQEPQHHPPEMDRLVRDLIKLLPWSGLVDERTNQPIEVEKLGIRVESFPGHDNRPDKITRWIVPVFFIGPDDVVKSTTVTFEPDGNVGQQAHSLDLYASGDNGVGVFSRNFVSLEWSLDEIYTPAVILVPVGIQSGETNPIEAVNVYVHQKFLSEEARSRAEYRAITDTNFYNPFL